MSNLSEIVIDKVDLTLLDLSAAFNMIDLSIYTIAQKTGLVLMEMC